MSNSYSETGPQVLIKKSVLVKSFNKASECVISNMERKKASLVVITGASRGIGQAIAEALAPVLAAKSAFLLLARTKEGMEKTRRLVLDKNPQVGVALKEVDLMEADANSLRSVIKEGLDLVGSHPEDFSNLLLFHNVGSVMMPGSKEKEFTANFDDREELIKYYNLNLISLILLNSVCFELFDACIENKLVVDINSGLTRNPPVNSGNYTAAKAAREHFLKVFAKENPSYRVLVYAAGAMDTKLTRDIRKVVGKDSAHIKFVNERYGGYAQPIRTAEKLVQVLLADKYNSGEYISFYLAEKYT